MPEGEEAAAAPPVAAASATPAADAPLSPAVPGGEAGQVSRKPSAAQLDQRAPSSAGIAKTGSLAPSAAVVDQAMSLPPTTPAVPQRVDPTAAFPAGALARQGSGTALESRRGSTVNAPLARQTSHRSQVSAGGVPARTSVGALDRQPSQQQSPAQMPPMDGEVSLSRRPSVAASTGQPQPSRSNSGMLRQTSQPALSRHASRVSGGLPAAGTPVDGPLNATMRSMGNQSLASGGPFAAAADAAAAAAAYMARPASTPEERIMELEVALAQKEKLVESLQRIHASDSQDKDRKETKLRETESRMNRELEKARADLRRAEDDNRRLTERLQAEEQTHTTRKYSRSTSELRKNLAASGEQASSALAQVAALQRREGELLEQLNACQTELASSKAECDDLHFQLQQAQEAILSSTAVSHANDIKLHQARWALQMVLQELGRGGGRKSPVPSRGTEPGDSASRPPPPANFSTPKYEFHYSPRRVHADHSAEVWQPSA
eukprot:TRINITY_DN12395_c0_g2_i1.p1 TRINITY_DN12395_c0_g2~~TRINITY_DN12395_c0_g2_i1.p1  ORF type:complete len:513 (+),score=145.64 TRINITY_DN12395_c0_g2_i1:61-1539(+)